jgi:hypothetical protein
MKEKDTAPTQGLQPITLPEPQKDGGKSVLASLWERPPATSVRKDFHRRCCPICSGQHAA